MRIPQSEIDRARDRSIVDVADCLGLSRKGTKAYCYAGHDSRTPSLQLFPTTNSWKCFGCGKGGDVIELVREVLQQGFIASVEWLLAGRVSSHRTPASRPRLSNGKRRVTSVHHSNRTPDPEVYEWILASNPLGDEGRAYLEGRGFRSDVVERFCFGEIQATRVASAQAVDQWGLDRLVDCGLALRTRNGGGIPLWRTPMLLIPFILEEQVTYMQGRQLSEAVPKYMGLAGIEKPLFNRGVLLGLPAGSPVLICEGAMDAIAAQQAGFDAVGILGALSFRREWVELLEPFALSVVPDADSAGSRFAAIVTDQFAEAGNMVEEVRLPSGSDLAEYLLESRESRR